MIVKLAYCNDLIPFKEGLQSCLNGVEFVSFNEEYYKEKKDAYKLKASCGARLLPFCAIYNKDKNLIKAFYSEVGQCTVNNIIKYINLNKNIYE